MGRQWARKRSTAVVATAALLFAAGCGQGEQSQGLAETGTGEETSEPTTGETAGSTADSVAEQDATEDTTAGGDESAESVPEDSPSALLVRDLNHDTPDSVSAGLQFGELRNLFVDVHGPTDDLADELNRIAIFPSAFPTMPGSDLYEFELRYNFSADPGKQLSGLEFHVEASAAEVLEFYESNLTGPEFELVATESRTEEDQVIETREYETPSSADRFYTGLVLDFVTGDFEGTRVAVSYSDELSPGEQITVLDRFSEIVSWHERHPIPEGGGPLDFGVRSTISDNGGPGAHWLQVDHSFQYPGANAVELAQTIYDLVPASEYDFKEPYNDDPLPEEILQVALDEDKSSVSYFLDHPPSGHTAHISASPLNVDSPTDPTVRFSRGDVDLRTAP